MTNVFRQFNFPLNVYAYLLWKTDGLEALHYGFFKDSSWSLAEAQKYASKLLFENIPPGVTDILDVGVGVGTSAKCLAEQGYEVTTISVDEAQVSYAENILRNNNVILKHIAYEDLRVSHKYDLILFQESSQYVLVNDIFGHAGVLLGDKGHILIMDEIALDDVGYGSSTVQLRGDYLNHASRAGFVLEKEIDFTDLAAPTISRLGELLALYRQEIVEELATEAPMIEDLIRANKRSQTLYEHNHLAYRLFLFKRRGPKSGFYVRPYKNGDELAINELFKEVFKKDHSDLWGWKFMSRGAPSYAILAFRDQRLVAQYTGLSRDFTENGRIISAVHVCDVMVHPRARGQMKLDGAFASTAKTFIERNVGKDKRFQFSYGFPNRRVLALAVRLGLYEEVTPLFLFYREELRNYHETMWKLAPLLSWQWPSVDKLWNQMRKDFADSVVGVRDSEYLKWRYREHPNGGYIFLALTNRFLKTIVAIAVVRESDHQVIIVDLICKKKHFLLLVRLVESYFERKNIPRLELFISGGFRYFMDNSGFTLTETEITVPRIIWAGDRPVEEIKDRLFLMIGDSDLC